MFLPACSHRRNALMLLSDPSCEGSDDPDLEICYESASCDADHLSYRQPLNRCRRCSRRYDNDAVFFSAESLMEGV